MRRAEPFSLVYRGEDLPCQDVLGFAEAVCALASLGRDAAPRRLVIVMPAPATARFLAAWAEDLVDYRRHLTVRSVLGDEVAVTVTLASHGYGVETSLAVESLTTGDLRRSGIRPRLDVALHHFAE